MIKDAHELELMRLASQATLKCYEAVFQALQPGMTQNEVSSLIGAAYGRLGFPGVASVQVGEYTALPHGSITPQTIREGTIIMIDDGCTVEGYQSDITRTFVLGKATDKMKKVFDIVHQAQTAALKAARPGVALESVDAAARKVVVDAGYGPGFKYFTPSPRPRHGHGRARVAVPGEEQHVRLGQGADAQPGMVFSDEPGIYIRASSACGSRTTCTSPRTARSCSRRRARRSKIRSVPGDAHRVASGAYRASTYTHARAPDWRTTATRLTAGTSYWSAFSISPGVTVKTVPGITSEARPVNLAMVWCDFPLMAMTFWSSIVNETSSNPGNASLVPSSSRPNVAI